MFFFSHFILSLTKVWKFWFWMALRRNIRHPFENQLLTLKAALSFQIVTFVAQGDSEFSWVSALHPTKCPFAAFNNMHIMSWCLGFVQSVLMCLTTWMPMLVCCNICFFTYLLAVVIHVQYLHLFYFESICFCRKWRKVPLIKLKRNFASRLHVYVKRVLFCGDG